MATTPVYGFPYPTTSDSPHGPNNMSALALAVEARFVAVAATNAKRLQAFLTTDYTVTTSEADLGGASLTFTTTGPNALAVVHATYECRGITPGYGYIRCRLMVDGVTQTREVLFTAASGETRSTVDLDLDVTLAAVGSHTLKLRALQTTGGGSAAIVGGSTGATQIGITLYDS